MKQKLLDQAYLLPLLIGLYLLWSAVGLQTTGRLSAESTHLATWGLLFLLFLTVRLLPRKNWVLWMLVAAGLAQSICAIGQQAGYLASNHSLFSITGFMGNPGQLGGFQAVAFIAGVVLFAKSAKRSLRLFGLIPALAIIVYSLCLADSRASWLAVTAGLAIVYWPKIRMQLAIRKWLSAPLLIVTIAAVTLLFNYRGDSANARLLIWRVSADMAADKPLAGHGAGGFNQQYMRYQAQYFECNPDSRFLMVADNAAYPYNEFLHVLIEQGIVGLILFLSIIAAVVATAVDKRMLAPLAAMLTFSFFSYPSYKFGLLMLFPLLFGCVESRGTISISSRYRYLFLTLVVMLAVVIGVRQVRFYSHVKECTSLLMCGYDRDAADFVTQNFNRLAPRQRYNSLYLYWMLKYPQMMDEEKLARIFPSCENWCDIGDYYTTKGMYNKAETYYRTASQMIPTRILPKYRLWKIYLDQGKTTQAQQIAWNILSQPLKVENTFTLRAKGEIKRYYTSF